jgi:hypothetical protein
MVFRRQKCWPLTLFLLAPLMSIAQYKVRTLGHKEDKDLAFPIFSGENKIAAKKINDHLQRDFFDTTTSTIPESGLFEEYRFISGDSITQPGYTSILYDIELNNSKILSVTFEVEGMGAYPSYYHKYFSFNANDGSIISAENIFTAEGLAHVKKILIEKRNKEIRKAVNELKANDSSGFLEDSTFIFERFESCNEEAEEKNLFIQKESVLFYKHNCFPHAWGPYETDLDIKFTYKELEKYLSAFGKKVLIIK